jgi:hypothetical protein
VDRHLPVRKLCSLMRIASQCDLERSAFALEEF